MFGTFNGTANHSLSLNYDGFPVAARQAPSGRGTGRKPVLPYTIYLNKQSGGKGKGGKGLTYSHDNVCAPASETIIPYELPLGIRVLECNNNPRKNITYDFNERKNYIPADKAIAIHNGSQWCYMTSVFHLLYNCLNVMAIEFLYTTDIDEIDIVELLPNNITKINKPKHTPILTGDITHLNDQLWNLIKQKRTIPGEKYPDQLNANPHPLKGQVLHEYDDEKINKLKKRIIYFLQMINIYYRMMIHNHYVNDPKKKINTLDTASLDGKYPKDINDWTKLITEAETEIGKINNPPTSGYTPLTNADKFFWYRIGLSAAIYPANNILNPNDHSEFIIHLLEPFQFQRNINQMLLENNILFKITVDYTLYDVNNNELIDVDRNNSQISLENGDHINIQEEIHNTLILNFDEYDEDHVLHQNVHISKLLNLNKQPQTKYSLYYYYHEYLYINSINTKGDADDKKLFVDNKFIHTIPDPNYDNYYMGNIMLMTDITPLIDKISKFFGINKDQIEKLYDAPQLIQNTDAFRYKYLDNTRTNTYKPFYKRTETHKYDFSKNKHLIIDLRRCNPLLYLQNGNSKLNINMNIFYYNSDKNKFFYDPDDGENIVGGDRIDAFKLKGVVVAHPEPDLCVRDYTTPTNFNVNTVTSHYHYTSFNPNTFPKYTLDDSKKTIINVRDVDSPEYKSCRTDGVLLLYQKINLTDIIGIQAAGNEYKNIYQLYTALAPQLDLTFQPLKQHTRVIPVNPPTPPPGGPGSTGPGSSGPGSSGPGSSGPGNQPLSGSVQPTMNISQSVQTFDIKQYIQTYQKYIETESQDIYSKFTKYKEPQPVNILQWQSTDSFINAQLGGRLVDNQTSSIVSHRDVIKQRLINIYDVSNGNFLFDTHLININTTPTVKTIYPYITKKLNKFDQITKNIMDSYSGIVDLTSQPLSKSEHAKQLNKKTKELVLYYQELYDAYQVIQYNLFTIIINNQMLTNSSNTVNVTPLFTETYEGLKKIFNFLNANLDTHAGYLLSNHSNLETLVDESLIFKLNEMNSAIITLIEEIQK